MQTKPFAVKQTAKEKEITSDKLITKEPLKDAQDGKVHKDGKDQKDQKEQKEHKEQKEQKEHKEKLEKEKHEHKEISKEHLAKEHLPKEALLEKLPEVQQQVQPDEATMAAAAALPKLVEHKFTIEKFNKVEILEKSHYKNEKIEHKDVFEKFYEGPQDPGGPVEARLAALEANMAQLMHFIPAELRPDLSQGALKQEPDAPPPAEDPAAEATPKEHKKK